MPNATRLQILVDLRRQLRPRLSQSAVARKFDLDAVYGRKAISAWELGEAIPSRDRRVRFMGYLWDDLGLRRTPNQFEEIWQILVEEWQWSPISDEEWQAHFKGVKRKWRSQQMIVPIHQESAVEVLPHRVDGAASVLSTLMTLGATSGHRNNRPEATYLLDGALRNRQGQTTESMLTEMGYFQ